MNKVITINLNGNAYQLDEPGYEIVRAYLDAAARNLADNPDRDEVLRDVEQAIGDKCRAALNRGRTVVSTADIEMVLAEMGPVQDSASGSEPGGPAAQRSGAAAGAPPRKLYRIYEGAMISGICNGIAAYFSIDVTLVRVLFAVVAVISGGGALVAYAAMWFIIPEAKTPAQMSAAHGVPATAEEIVRRAREGVAVAKQGYAAGLKALREPRPERPALIILVVLLGIVGLNFFFQYMVPAFGRLFNFRTVPIAYAAALVGLSILLAWLLVRRSRARK